jgi:ABC-type lipoprotein export system ATPase subunit
VNDVRLGALNLEGFRSFRSMQTVRFPARGMVAVRGRSGHGKSNLALGISHALGYCPKPSTELQAWDWDAKWGARAFLEVTNTDWKEAAQVEVERGSKFDLVIDGEKITGSAASKNQRQNDVVGLEPDLLRALTYRPQRTFGLFLSLSDDDKKEFLTKLLGLDRFEREAESVEKTFPDLDRALDTAVNLAFNETALRDQLLGQEFPVQDEQAVFEQAEQARKKHEATAIIYANAEAQVLAFEKQAKDDEDQSYRAALQDVQEVEQQAAEERRNRPPLPDAEITAEQTRLQDLIAKAAVLLKKLQSEDNAKQDQVQQEREQIRTRISWRRSAISLEPRYRKTLDQAKHELEHLVGGTTCPTCKQEWTAGGEKLDLIARARNTITEMVTGLDGVAEHQQGLAEDEARLATLTFTPNPKVEQMLQAKSQAEQKLAAEQARAGGARKEKAAEYAAQDATWREGGGDRQGPRRARARRRYVRRTPPRSSKPGKLSSRSRQRRSASRAEHWRLSSALQSLQASNKVQRENAERRDRQLAQVEKELADAERNLDDAKRKAGEARDFSALTRSYLDRIFDEVLAEIAHETNNVLLRVPNVQHISFAFKSEVEAKTSGKKKAKITPVVRIDGVERPFSGLSGGQTSVVELGTDIAIRRVVSNRRQVHIGWMLLDEAFDGLGRAEKEACMEVLQAAAQDDLILVVDHATEFRDMFTQFINIEMVQGESRVGQ